MKSSESLQNFILDEGRNLEKLRLFLRVPNYFEILGISHRELQHSNFLSWMMNSKASHNAGNYFLKSFLNLLPFTPEDRIRINLSDLNQTKIYREFRGIDLIIENSVLNFIVCIENKVRARKSGNNQLVNYHKTVENIWSSHEQKKYYVYLTPAPRTLTEKEIEIEYVNITYESILVILEDTILSKTPSSETKPLIDNYILNLKNNVMQMSKESQLAREIYKRHKAAIDFIVQNKPNLYSPELFLEIKEFFTNSDKYHILTPSDMKIIRFLPTDLIGYFNHDSKSWLSTQASFALELFLEQDRIWIKFCFGGIFVKDQNEKIELQRIKQINMKKMKSFNSIARNVLMRSKSTTNYPSVANFDIIKIDDKLFSESATPIDAFVTKFEIFEGTILEPWTIEVKTTFG